MRYGTYIRYQDGWDQGRGFDNLPAAKHHAEGYLENGDVYEVQVVDEKTGVTVFSLIK